MRPYWVSRVEAHALGAARFKCDASNIGRAWIAQCPNHDMWRVIVRVLGGVVEAEFPEWWMCVEFANAELWALRDEVPA